MPGTAQQAEIVNNMDTGVSIEQLSHGAIFRKRGKMHNHLAYGHLHLALKMTGLIQRREKLVEINQHVQNWNIYRIKNEEMMSGMYVLRQWVNRTILSTTARIDAILLTMGGNGTFTKLRRRRDFKPTTNETKYKREETPVTEALFKKKGTIVEHPRTKRQLLIGIGGAIVGGFISSIVSDFQQDTLMDVIQRKQSLMATEISNNLIHTNQNSKDIARLAEAVKAVRRGMITLYNNTQIKLDTHTHMIHLMTTISEEAHAVEKLVSAVEEARSGKFSLGLCKPEGLAKALEELQKIGLQDGRSLGINTMLDLPHMPMSYVIDVKNHVLHAIVHVPMERSGNYLTLLEYLDNPVQVINANRTPMYLEVDLKGTYLAVSGDQSRYMIYTEEDLRKCHIVQNEYFCDNMVIYKESRRSCIKALYDNDPLLIHSLCPMTIATEVSKAIRLNGTTYIITETEPQTITITCGEQKTTRKMKITGGTYMVHINKGCTFTSNSILIEIPKFQQEIEVDGVLTSEPWVFEEWIPHHELPEFLNTASKYLETVGKKVPVKKIKSLMKFKKDMREAERADWESWAAGLHPGGLLSHIGTIVFCICLAILGYKLFVCVRGRQMTGQTIINLPTFLQRQTENDTNKMIDNRKSKGVMMSEVENNMAFEELRAENMAAQRQLEEEWRQKEKRREERRLRREDSYKKIVLASGHSYNQPTLGTGSCPPENSNEVQNVNVLATPITSPSEIRNIRKVL